MAKTYLDQIVDYPSKVILRLSQDKQCVGFLVNKGFDKVTEEDMDVAIEEHIMDYQYVDETTQETTAFVWVEMEVNQVANTKFKNTKLYVTVACHKNYMKLPRQTFKGISGNRRDNLVRYIDKVLNNSDFLGIGTLKLNAVRTLSPINGFTAREITYEVPDFNVVNITE